MKISSLSLISASGQTQNFGAVTDQASLKLRLKEILEAVVFEESSLNETDGAAGNGALTMPMLVVQAKLQRFEITFTYDMLSKEEGLLALFYTNSKGGRERQKEFGFIGIGELEEHLQRLLSMSKQKLVEHYFPKNTPLQQLVNYSVITYISAAFLGLLSFIYFSDLVWRGDIFRSVYIAGGVVYAITLPILLLKAVSPDSRERAEQMGQSLLKQVFAIIIGNLVLSFALVAGGCNLVHVISAKPAKIEIIFSDKRKDYWGKHCKGGVNIEQFSGAICLEDRAYWKIISPGMRATAEGKLSTVAFDMTAIEL
ncbi:hypothetical protein L1D44_07620 [Shewanella sp. Isolate13]|uniref:hypothetical protein n=1 Tax=Shewanella sp. Isolate13 TaxID=2908531 RepID=UPI001EFD2908|nr:hypothetical protein [Shewanella sp. Isolate13]MCG9729718.1 hypothetical protein [Shewanella sp. Isolate13]